MTKRKAEELDSFKTTASMSEIYSFGLGSFGQLGHGTEENELKPRLIESLKGINIVQISCGNSHTCKFIVQFSLLEMQKISILLHFLHK